MARIILPSLQAFWVTVALFIALSCYGPTPAHADHNGPWLPGDMMGYPMQARFIERGYVAYCFDGVAAAYPRFKYQAAESVAAALENGSMPAYEVPTGAGCDVYIQAPSHSAFVSTCGSGAYGCIYYWHSPVDIYFDLQGSSAAYYNNSAISHEGINCGHNMGLHEEYNDRSFTSNGRTWTVMDFGVRDPNDPLGRNVWRCTDWDIDRIWNEFVPDAPANVGLSTSGGWATVSWDQNRRDGGRAHANGVVTNSNATLMGFGWASCTTCEVHNVAEYCPAAFNYCAQPFKYGARSFDAYWKGCLFVRAWNQSFGNVPQVSAPNYWVLAGCW